MPRILALALSLVGIAATLQAAPVATVNSIGVVLLPDPMPLQTLGRSQLPLITDLYWLRAINLGPQVKTPLDGRTMLMFGNFITALDPLFKQAYWYSSLNAMVSVENGGWANAPEAAAILEEGRKKFPQDVFMSLALAFNYMTYQRDFVKAAGILQEAARIPNAPTYFALLATRLLAAAGHPERSREVALQFLESAPDDETREFFSERLKAIDLEEMLISIDKAADKFKQDTGRDINTITDLYNSGYLSPHSLRDPYGGSFEWSPDGGAYSTSHPERLKLHE
jgi:hypothetical protein